MQERPQRCVFCLADLLSLCFSSLLSVALHISPPHFVSLPLPSLSLLDHSPPDLLCLEHTNIFSVMSASCLA